MRRSSFMLLPHGWVCVGVVYNLKTRLGFVTSRGSLLSGDSPLSNFTAFIIVKTQK